ncbi:MAG: hypothetical protein HKN33_19215, partial [Pyrinomonadaceae bacterium]|nr:hypothetical protein [Pyrinomonadaceae bacterium]
NAGCGAPTCSFGRGINDRGDVVGWGVGGIFPGGPKGFKLDKHGTLTVIGFPGATVTQANGINDNGEIVGLYLLGGPPQAYLRTKDGTYSNVDFPGSISSQAWGINSRGQIVGQYDDGSGTHAYLRNQDGTFQSFDFPAGMVASGTLFYTRFRDINDKGEIVGYYRVTGGNFPVVEIHGFHLDQKGNIHPIDFPVGPQTTENFYVTLVHGINNRGVISGGYIFADTTMGPPLEHGFVRNKKGVFTTVDFPGARQTEIYKVSESGLIVGGAQDFMLESNAFLSN